MWPVVGSSWGRTGSIESLIEVVPAGRTKVPEVAKSWAWGWSSGVAIAISRFLPLSTPVVPLAPSAPPAAPAGGISQRYGATVWTPS